MDYLECVLFDAQKCGPYKPKSVEGIFVVLDLLEDVSEQKLIESRIYRTLSSDDKICPFHRFKFGKQYTHAGREGFRK